MGTLASQCDEVVKLHNRHLDRYLLSQVTIVCELNSLLIFPID